MKTESILSSPLALCVAAALLAGVGTVPAQVPQLISYQSRVVADGTNFHGTGHFKFALVNPAGNVTYWSNNGSSVGGSQPNAAVSLPVADGLAMTLLGDTTLANMSAIPSSVFANPDVRLRVWFNGGSGFEQLAPDQRIVSVGYAMMAATVPDGSITAAKLAPGVLSPANFPPNSVGSTQLGDNLDLGATNVIGQLDIFRTSAGTPAISLFGSSSRISTYGSDGLEQIRLWGVSYGEVLLNNNQENNATAVRLTAQGATGGQLELRNTNGANRAVLEGENVGGRLTLYQGDGNTGAVLYGNEGSTEGGALSLRKSDGNAGLRAYGGNTAGYVDLINRFNNVSLRLWNYDNEEGVVSVRNSSGDETIYLWGRDSTGSGHGQIGLKRSDGTETVTIQASEFDAGGQILLYNADRTANTVQIDAQVGSTGGGYLDLKKSDGTASIVLRADNGTMTSQVVEITGGSDFSEKFDILGDEAEVEPGMLVCIDPDHPGRLMPSRRSYDRTAAGVISGAGGVSPGMLMGQPGTLADGKHPVALSGRVYAWVDASYGEIRPGDLITTSDTPGHGMKVTDHVRAAGAMVGKAMTGLESGRGLVLLLVSLQ